MQRTILVLIASLVLTGLAPRGEAAPAVSVVTREALSPPIEHGLSVFMGALQQRGIEIERVDSFQRASKKLIIVAGLAHDAGPAAELIRQRNISAPSTPESLLIRTWKEPGEQVVLAAGADALGLMYALLDMADRIAWASASEGPFSEISDLDESPFTRERALSIYTFNRAYWESRFYDEAYWARYLDLLARNRFNSLVLIFGYENGGFLAPCYPYFFDLEGFPEVRMVGITGEQQSCNLAALNRLIQMAHDRGLSFTVGIWDHIYRGGVQGGGIPGADEATRRPTPGLVWGVTSTNLMTYTKAALARFLQLVPAVDALQLRMHDESGLRADEQEAFWRDVFQTLKQSAPQVRLDLRAKGLPDSVIQSALDTGVDFRITTKYWMEQMGLPFHPSHINRENQFDRRHSYADLLRYPQRYRIHWRLWNGGTARVLLWGDPDYARRFVESTHLYDGDGFEVNEPLCTKMEAQPHDTQPFQLLRSSHRYYDYEFERYWHFFQVFGRIGYNPETTPQLWKHEFERRFGAEAAPFLEEALHRASWVLPRIVASCYPYGAFPMTRGWAEKQRLGDLPAYAKAEGSDIAQFASFDEEAQLLIGQTNTAKVRPPENSQWFATRAELINQQITEAEQNVGAHRNKEFESTLADLKILANLALFHSRRIPAAVSYRLFQRTKDPQSLEDAIRSEREAIEAWRQLVSAAGDFYNDDLMMGVRGAGLSGHWKDELSALEKGLAKLESERTALSSAADKLSAPRFSHGGAGGLSNAPIILHVPLRAAAAGSPLTVTAEVRSPVGIDWVRLRYRGVNQQQDYRTLPMLPIGKKDQYQVVVPADEIKAAWDFMYYIEAMDQRGNGRIDPDLNVETPYVVVRLQR